MKMYNIPALLGLLFCCTIYGQIKIGDNPQIIDPSSVLELESRERVLVITRVSTAEMNAIMPLRGALVYNTDVECVHYYDGNQWVNLCENNGTANITADPIIHDIPTIALTPSADGTNIEIAENSIRSEMIVDGGINGVDIQNGSIGPGKLQNNSVTQDKLSENSVGAFALDNANIGLTDFTNDAGFITNANIVSTAANNAITNNGGAFFDDTDLANGIQSNTDAINALVDPTLQQVLAQGNIAGDLIRGLEDPQAPQDATNKRYVDAEILAAITAGGGNPNDELITDVEFITSTNVLRITEGGNVFDTNLGALAGGTENTTDELTDLAFNPATNILTLTNPATGNNEADLSSLAGGSGSTQLADQNTIIGDGSLGNEFQIANNAINSARIANETILSEDILDGTLTTADYADRSVTNLKIAPGASNQILRTNVGGTDVAWVDLPASGNPAASDVTFTPTGNTTSFDVQTAIEELQTEIDGISTGGAANPNDELITSFALNGTGLDIAEGATIQPTVDLNPVFATDIELAAAIAASNQIIVSTDVPNSITAGIDGGALYDDPDNDPGNEIQNLAEVLTDGNDAGGAPIKNIGTPIDPGDATTKAYVDAQVVSAGTIVSTDTPNSISPGTDGGALYDDSALVTVTAANSAALALKEDLANKSTDIALGNSDTDYPSQNAVKTYVDNQIASVSGGQNLSNTNLTQLVGQNRTYDLNGQELIFSGSGNVGVGDFGNSGPASIRSKFDVDGQITASNGFASTEGTVGNPGYGFYTNNDTNTGMYRNAEDELSFSAGGQEMMRLAESVGNGLEITAFGSLELEDELRDINGNAGTAGQILSSTGAGVEWINSPAVGNADWTTITNIPAGFADNIDDNTQYTAGAGLTLTGTTFAFDNSSITPDWNTLINVPAGFADDTDDDTTYSAGAGLTLSGTTFSLDGSSISVDWSNIINIPTGFSDDIDDDTTYTAGIGISLVGNTFAFDATSLPVGSIDGTRVNPDFGAQNIVTTGNLTVNGPVTVGGIPVHPDYVFQKYFLGNSILNDSYDFQSLEEIEAFVKKYHHLPGIKSAAQVKKEGSWNLSESNIQNLEKIEELFLHTIEQENKIKQLQKENQTISNELIALKKELEAIKNLIKKSN
ncbi:hypothetical protein ACEZ3G_14600 [Maribacter algicola]|uniref:Uncharacterized protein n=1 Tax=Meishania litoralis TaxID=3434685 RepID=A0ACC7LLT4_9FLAO